MANDNDTSTLVQTNSVIDISQIRTSSLTTEELRKILLGLSEDINTILLNLNSKENGLYEQIEQITGQSYFNNDSNYGRPVYRRVIDFGALPNTASKSVNHGLDSSWAYKFTRILAVSSDSTNKKYIPIPYASSTSADIVELSVDSSNVIITTGKDRTSFDTTYVVLEYCDK